jgi:hypothetical protein
MITKKLQDALVEAQDGLRALNLDFDALRKRKEQLERLVASLTEVLNASLGMGEGNGALAQESPAAEHAQPDTAPRAVWQLAQELLTFAGQSLSVPDIVAGIAARGTTVDSETVRVAMYRKPDIFSKTERGRYGLRSWDSADIGLVAVPVDLSARQEVDW